MSNALYQPGTYVQVSDSSAVRSGPGRYLVLDPAIHTPGEPGRGCVLVSVPSPHGWDSRTQADVRCWWVPEHAVSPAVVEPVTAYGISAEPGSPLGDLLAEVDSAGWLDGTTPVRALRLADAQQIIIDRQKEEILKRRADFVRVIGEFDTFKDKVRHRILDARVEHGLCISGTNEVLSDLGLGKVEREYEVTVVVRAEATLTITVTASDEDDAQERVDHEAVEEALDGADWEWDGEHDVEGVREA